jgi:hypothetical protein
MTKRKPHIWIFLLIPLQILILVNNTSSSYGAERVKPLEGFNWYNEISEQKKEKIESLENQQKAKYSFLARKA